MVQGGSVPTIVPVYSGFVNGDTASSLNTRASCTTTATSTSPASPPTYPSTCSGASDSNYSISYVPGAVTVIDSANAIAVSVSGTQTYGGGPTFLGTATAPPPSGISVDTSGLTCGDVTPVTSIAPTLPAGTDNLVAPSCSGAILRAPAPPATPSSTPVPRTTSRSALRPSPSPPPAHHGLRLEPADHHRLVLGLRQRRRCLVIERAAQRAPRRPPVRVPCPARRIRRPAAGRWTPTTPSATCQAG